MIMILLVVLCAAAGAAAHARDGWWCVGRRWLVGAVHIGWRLAAAAGPCWQHMAHAAVRAFCTTENDKNKKN